MNKSNKRNTKKGLRRLGAESWALVVAGVMLVFFIAWGYIDASINRNATDGRWHGTQAAFAFIIPPAFILLAGIIALYKRSAGKEVKKAPAISSSKGLAVLYWIGLALVLITIADWLFIASSTLPFAIVYPAGFLVGFGSFFLPVVGIIGIVREKSFSHKVIPMVLLGIGILSWCMYILSQMGN